MLIKATLKDLPFLIELEEKIFEPYCRFSKKSLINGIKKGYITIFSSLINEYDGYVFIRFCQRYINLVSIGLQKNKQNFGLGSIMIRQVEKFMYKHSNMNKTVRLACSPRNEKALRFYRKNGYIEYGIKNNFYRDGSGAILFKKNLNKQFKDREKEFHNDGLSSQKEQLETIRHTIR